MLQRYKGNYCIRNRPEKFRHFWERDPWFCSLLEFHLRDILLVFYIYGLFKMVFDCLWVVVDLFEVVVDGC